MPHLSILRTGHRAQRDRFSSFDGYTIAPCQKRSSPHASTWSHITPEALRSEQAADGTLASILNCRVPSSWPHVDWEPYVFDLLLTTFAEHPEDTAWHRYILLRSKDQEKPVLIGTTGAFRWPSNRSEAEFGYAILPEFRLHGYATEAAKTMLAWIDSAHPNTSIIAHTYPELAGSIRILERCNFTLTGPGEDPALSATSGCNKPSLREQPLRCASCNPRVILSPES